MTYRWRLVGQMLIGSCAISFPINMRFIIYLHFDELYRLYLYRQLDVA